MNNLKLKAAFFTAAVVLMFFGIVTAMMQFPVQLFSFMIVCAIIYSIKLVYDFFLDREKNN